LPDGGREGEAPAGGPPPARSQPTTIFPCIQGCTAQRKYSVVPGFAVTLTVMLLCLPPGWMAMLSPTRSSPAAPLFSTQWTIGFASSGAAFGFFRWPVA